MNTTAFFYHLEKFLRGLPPLSSHITDILLWYLFWSGSHLILLDEKENSGHDLLIVLSITRQLFNVRFAALWSDKFRKASKSHWCVFDPGEYRSVLAKDNKKVTFYTPHMLFTFLHSKVRWRAFIWFLQSTVFKQNYNFQAIPSTEYRNEYRVRPLILGSSPQGGRLY